MNMDNKLDDLLIKRVIPDPSSNLANRINAMAEEALIKKRNNVNNLSLSELVLRMFIIPKPAYVTAFCLAFGLTLGLYGVSSDITTQDWFSFLSVQQEEWL